METSGRPQGAEGERMIILWATLGITLALAVVIIRNADERCREAKGIITGVLLGSAIWIGGILLWKYLI